MRFKTFFTDENDNEVSVTVSFNFYRGMRGARDSLGGVRGAGPPLEPDSDPEIEITDIVDISTGKEVEVSEEIMDKFNEEAWEYLNGLDDVDDSD